MEPIDLNEAKKMVDNYHHTRKKLIDKTHGVNDTQSSWIPIDKLKSFVNNLPDHATGVRIHLAAYDHDHAHFPNQTTTVLIGTTGDNDVHTDAIQNENATLAADDSMGPFNKTKDCPPIC